MGLLQKACETYDSFAPLAGKYMEGCAPLCPVSHTITSAQIEIVLDRDGNFVSARRVEKNEPKTIIPVTEESVGRTSAPCAHPLCDQLDYLASGDTGKHQLYLEQLADWAASQYSHPKLKPVLAYITNGSILRDLSAFGIIELDEGKKPKDGKALVRWVVNGLGLEQDGPCWTDVSLFRAYIDYYAHRRRCSSRLCMVSGRDEPPAAQHPKGIIPINGNAKLISSNDSSNFTYRGRFTQDWQAATVGYTASQHAHSALRWIAANQGVRLSMPGDAAVYKTQNYTVFGGRTFLCWNPQGVEVPSLAGALRKRSGDQKPSRLPTEYQEQLRDTLGSWKNGLPSGAGVVIAAFDAATTGRLALTYYNELPASDFLDRLHRWDNSCCWHNGSYGIQSPSLYQIANFAFGTLREGRFVTDDRVLRQQMQRLIACRIDGGRFPHDIERRLAQRASNLRPLDGDARERLLSTACAVIQKYHYDRNKEDWNMATDLDKKDRSFQFGRLLAVLEKTEQYYYWKTGESKLSDAAQSSDRAERETNAIRMMSAFRKKPWSTYSMLYEKLRIAYLPRMQPWQREQFKKQTDDIVAIILALDKEPINKPLADCYLMGYHLQRLEMKPKTKTENMQEE